jgi:hypothetical protein
MISLHDHPLLFFIAKYSILFVLTAVVIIVILLPVRLILLNTRRNGMNKLSKVENVNNPKKNKIHQKDRRQSIIYWVMVTIFIILCVTFASNMGIYIINLLLE